MYLAHGKKQLSTHYLQNLHGVIWGSEFDLPPLCEIDQKINGVMYNNWVQSNQNYAPMK